MSLVGLYKNRKACMYNDDHRSAERGGDLMTFRENWILHFFLSLSVKCVYGVYIYERYV